MNTQRLLAVARTFIVVLAAGALLSLVSGCANSVLAKVGKPYPLRVTLQQPAPDGLTLNVKVREIPGGPPPARTAKTQASALERPVYATVDPPNPAIQPGQTSTDFAITPTAEASGRNLLVRVLAVGDDEDEYSRGFTSVVVQGDLAPEIASGGAERRAGKVKTPIGVGKR